ncbi:MAG: AAA family ATPase [Muribaculaceae bacterium]|nr:AAA family ATPase [Muribaculaceae bacterium]
MSDFSELTVEVYRNLDYEPLPSQARVIAALCAYAVGRKWRDVALLNGYAGTGKTSIIGAYVKALKKLKINSVVLAPTGRAAKVASYFTGGPASTIHKRIYRADSPTPDARFFLSPNKDKDTVFIVDEASLITDDKDQQKSLLSQLIRHIYAAPGCGLIFVGDEAQLPPVGNEDSPAMNTKRLIELGLNPIRMSLRQPVRQASESGILYNATILRRMLQKGMTERFPYLSIRGFKDVRIVSGTNLADSISDSWSEVGAEETLIVTRSNYRANEFNKAVRNLVMAADEPLQRGDRLVISKNDYYWSRKNELKNFIANGDIAIVEWVGHTRKEYGRYFCEVELFFPTEDTRISANLMLRSLMAEGPVLPRVEMEQFYSNVLACQEGDSLSKKIKGVMDDPYYNALHAKYGYCVTCHKAQGGQWKHVYIDLSGIARESLSRDFYRWCYTAITRATEKVMFVNPSFKIRE